MKIKYTKKLFLLCTLYLISFGSHGAMVISIPKSGTNLLKKTLMKMLKKPYIMESLMPSSLHDFNLTYISPKDLDIAIKKHKNSILHSHMHYSEERKKVLLLHKTKIIFNIRDPRDLTISRAFYLYQSHQFPQFSHLTFKELVEDYIKEIINEYNFFLPWMNYPYVVITRFEDLVGEKGNGNDYSQLKTLERIQSHLQTNFKKTELEKIGNTLFGDNAGTFREGKIGSWKEYLTSDQKDLFKTYSGDLLYKLGYEKNSDW